jgi:hypothetical protein
MKQREIWGFYRYFIDKFLSIGSKKRKISKKRILFEIFVDKLKMLFDNLLKTFANSCKAQA